MSDLSAVFRIIGPDLDRDEVVVGADGLQFGRASDNGLVLSSSEMSRRHFRFDWDGEQITVTDMNSSNGVYLNDERIPAGRATPMKVGDAVRAGPFVLTLAKVNVPKPKKQEAPAPPPEPPPTPKVEATPKPPADDGRAKASETATPSDGAGATGGVFEQSDDALASALDQIKRGTASKPVDEEKLAAADKPAKSTKPKVAAGAEDPVTVPPADGQGGTPPSDGQSFVFQPLSPDYAPSRAEPETPAVEPLVVEPPVVSPPRPEAAAVLEEKAKLEATPRSDARESAPSNGHGTDDPYLRTPPSMHEEPLPPVPYTNGHRPAYPIGLPHDASNWLKYLPAIYQADDFLGRYLLIFESVISPVVWIIDNFDLYLSEEMAPPEWLRWMGSWFDILIVPELPVDRQRAIFGQIGWLFFRRGTRAGLERLLELYWGVRPEIVEPKDEPGHFIVRMALSESRVKLGQDVLERLITASKPAATSFSVEIT